MNDSLVIPSQSQLLWVWKPLGWTSADVVRYMARFRITKVGHTGTLDPMASGLLGIVTNQATKQVEQLMNLPKAYEGVIRLGSKTDSADSAGWPVATKPVPAIPDLKPFEAKLLTLTTHRPPLASAIKVEGQRAYDLFRAGKTVELPEKPIKIHQASLAHLAHPWLISLKVTVSRGAYIRTLAEWVGEQLGTLGHLQELQRTQLHEWSLPDPENYRRADTPVILRAVRR